MKILFLTLVKLKSLDDTMVYTDLLHTFAEFGHDVYAICPLERRDGKANFVETKRNIHLLHANIGGNYFNTNIIEKGLTLLTLERGFIKAIKKQYANIQFDLVLYTTPPITFNNVVKFVKNRDKAKTYLMLKDIFPQNAVDMGMICKSGIKGILYNYFRGKEKNLYKISDVIGCMSQANIDYVLKHNSEISRDKVEICPNSIIVRDMSANNQERVAIRKKYNIPLDKIVFVYGGNLGKPQGIDFLVACLRRSANLGAYFLIVGDGTDLYKIEKYIKEEMPSHVRLIQRLSKIDYDLLVGSCDVGMIFLDHRFTIPNFPSRLLSYMQARLPVLAVTDPNTDIGHIAVEGGFGWWCESNDVDKFAKGVSLAMNSDLIEMGNLSFSYLQTHYDVEDYVKRIINHLS